MSFPMIHHISPWLSGRSNRLAPLRLDVDDGLELADGVLGAQQHLLRGAVGLLYIQRNIKDIWIYNNLSIHPSIHPSVRPYNIMWYLILLVKQCHENHPQNYYKQVVKNRINIIKIKWFLYIWIYVNNIVHGCIFNKWTKVNIYVIYLSAIHLYTVALCNIMSVCMCTC
jgi:hypothetical protein